MIKVNADLFRLTHEFITKDKHRYYLQGVHIEPHPTKGVLMVATDGHTMLVAHDPEGICSGENQIIALPKLVLSQCKTPKRETSNRILHHDGQNVKIIQDDNLVLTTPNQPIDGTFPDWRRVVGNPTSDGHTTNFNTKELDRFGAVAQHLTGRRDIHIRSWGSGTSYIGFHDTSQAFGMIISPLRFIIPDLMDY